MRVSLGLPIDRHGVGDDVMSVDGLRTAAQAAESAGFDAVFVTDHPAPDARWLRHGGHPTLDPFVALSVVAAHTTRLRLHTNLLVLPYRNPFLAAKAVASLDVLSAGRVILGIGVGYLRAEFEALGVEFDDRAALVDDAIVAMKAAWLGDPVHHDGVGYAARDTLVLPRPLQQPHPPIWVGGNSRAAMRRAVNHGQGWSPMPSPKAAASFLGTPGLESVDELAARIAELREMAAAAGRTDPVDVAVIPTRLSGFGDGSWSTDALVEEIGLLRDAGGTVLVVNLPGTALGEFTDNVAAFAETVLPHV